MAAAEPSTANILPAGKRPELVREAWIASLPLRPVKRTRVIALHGLDNTPNHVKNSRGDTIRIDLPPIKPCGDASNSSCQSSDGSSWAEYGLSLAMRLYMHFLAEGVFMFALMSSSRSRRCRQRAALEFTQLLPRGRRHGRWLRGARARHLQQQRPRTGTRSLAAAAAAAQAALSSGAARLRSYRCSAATAIYRYGPLTARCSSGRTPPLPARTCCGPPSGRAASTPQQPQHARTANNALHSLSLSL